MHANSVLLDQEQIGQSQPFHFQDALLEWDKDSLFDESADDESQQRRQDPGDYIDYQL